MSIHPPQGGQDPRSVADHERPPTVWPVVAFTSVFGPLAALSARRRAGRAAQAGHSGSPYWRAFWCTLLAVIIPIGVLVASSSASIKGPQPSPDPWTGAGVAKPQISSRVEQGRHIVTVAVRTSLPLPDDDNRSGFSRRAAKIVWRTQSGRLDQLDLTTGETVPGAPQKQTWQRPELEASFGPRPAGLDAGNSPPPGPAPAATGPYRHPVVATLDDAGTTIEQLLKTIASDFFHQEAAKPEPGNDTPCLRNILGGLLGEKETGKVERGFNLSLTLPGKGQAEAQLPDLATYLASLGLEVRSDSLYDGLPFLYIKIPNLGRMQVMTYWPDQGSAAIHKIVLGATTGCQQP